MAEAPANSVHPLSRAEWRAWLDENHKRDEGGRFLVRAGCGRTVGNSGGSGGRVGSVCARGGQFRCVPALGERGILEWISSAKRPETRAKRVDETARLAQQNVRANQ